MIVCRNLTFKNEEGKEVFKNVNLSLESGKVGVIIGLNGSGKTTLLECIGGNKKCSGMIKTDENSRYIKELPSFCDELTGYEYLQILFSLSGDKNNDNILSIIKSIGIDQDMKKLIKDCYQYTRNILVMLTSLSLDSDTLLLDDPFHNLDRASQLKVIELIKLLKNQNKTILLSTNILHFGYDIADEIFILHKGKIKSFKNLFKNIQLYESKIMPLIMR